MWFHASMDEKCPSSLVWGKKEWMNKSFPHIGMIILPIPSLRKKKRKKGYIYIYLYMYVSPPVKFSVEVNTIFLK